MLGRILKAVVPSQITNRIIEKKEATDAVIERSRMERRAAEAQMIHAYRELNLPVKRHDWRH